MRVAAQEVEEAIMDRLQLLAEDPDMLHRLTAETNWKLQQSRPELEREQSGLEKDIFEVKAMADKLLNELVFDGPAGGSIVRNGQVE